ncbi:hypothetical protein [Halostagnicola kamekurae]|uniref:Uncharacterized protein n=1 Tax=Halostagnicola kamekurae TaxID=619731 RepID=A0A1I6UND5_9EURY|nr:hypothetical protein [Halostagnicola kamekurae]SFT02908.1 hypothetical protein SAMN04488556_3954 [Halostagnicola kamekurae]
MGQDPFRDLHEASLFTNTNVGAFREFHHRRLDALRKPSCDIKAVEHGAVIVNVAAPEFLENSAGDHIDPVELMNNHEKWPTISRGKRTGEHASLDHCGIIAVNKATHEGRESVTRIDRHGILESVSTTIFSNRNQSGDRSLLSTSKLEQGLVEVVGTYTDRVRDGVQENTLVIVSYVNLENAGIFQNSGPNRHPDIKGSIIRTPVTSLGTASIRDELIPVIRPLWNAVGDQQSRHMNNGEWEYEPKQQFDW